jgi:murein DD-endopeptidase MepM/ murein hydrolase activator NlpD
MKNKEIFYENLCIFYLLKDKLQKGGVFMENKNNNKKTSNFLRREGFYVVLFLCLCIIATVAAIATRNSKKIEEKPQTSQTAKVDLDGPNSVNISQKDKEINNAVQVQDNTKNKNTGIEIPTKQEVAVSKTTEPTFIKPVEGSIVMKYSQTPVWWETSQTSRPNFGINIKAKVGTSVKAVADGEVKLVEQDSSFGTKVTIYHPSSGKATTYGNLDKEVKVKMGDKVTQGQQIGKIGRTSLRGMSEEIGSDFLHFEVLKNLKEEVQLASENPEKYVKY